MRSVFLPEFLYLKWFKLFLSGIQQFLHGLLMPTLSTYSGPGIENYSRRKCFILIKSIYFKAL